jgi:hypothetical protein
MNEEQKEMAVYIPASSVPIKHTTNYTILDSMLTDGEQIHSEFNSDEAESEFNERERTKARTTTPK